MFDLRKLPLGFHRRAVTVLLCAVSTVTLATHAFAQDASLRGTSSDVALETQQNLLKNPKAKTGIRPSRLMQNAPILVQERYQPTELDANSASNGVDANNSDFSASTLGGTPEQTSSDLELPAQGTQNTPAGIDNRAVGSASIDQAEIPEPFSREASDGSLQRDEVGRSELENERTGSIEGKAIAAQDDPFAAPGIRAGTFVLRPTFEAGIRSSNNPNDPTCDCFANRAESSLLVRAQSDWAQHAINFEGKADFTKAFSNTSGLSNARTFENGFRLSVDGRLDLTAVDQITASASYERAGEVLDASSRSSFVQRPTVGSLRGSLGYKHDAGLISVGGTLSLSRQTYSDALDLTGVAVAQDDRDVTNVTGTLRTSYALSPVFRPFVELELGRRLFDNRLDSAGIANSAKRYALRTGSEINFGEKLSGELSGGWFVENIDDATLRNISGVDLRGTVNWSPVRLTNVALTLETRVDSPRSVNSSNSVVNTASAEFTRRLRDNLDARALVSAAYRNFQGSEASLTTLTAEAGGTWWLNRYTGIKGSAQHSQYLSSDATRKRSSSGVYLGVVLRR